MNSVRNVFGTSGQVKNSGEYWIVRAGEKALLLPQPVNDSRFRDLACFEGDPIAPKALRSIIPATLRQNGNTLILVQAGRIA